MKDLKSKPKNLYSQIAGENQFKMKLSSKAFHIFSNQLYQNKIRAIIRELSCNAMDAHVAAGNSEKPFDIKLPNQLNPYFYIRDYGTGISEEDIFNVFVVVFESTKEDSNDFTGMLGLGSKSPFAYTENFIVTSYQNGVEKTYSCFMDQNKVPTVDKIYEGGTSEENGLKIQFPVSQDDFSNFFSETRYVFETFFDLKPNIYGAEDVLQEIEFKEFLGGKIKKVNHFESTHDAGIYVVQGNISYPVDSSKLSVDFIKNAGIYDLYSVIYICFDIGSVSFVPSREQLEDTSHNRSVINKIINSKELINEIDDIINSEIDKVRTKAQAFRLLASHKYLTGLNCFNYFSKKLIDKGFDLSNFISVDVTGFDVSIKRNPTMAKENRHGHNYKCASLKEDILSFENFTRHSDDIFLFISDIKKGSPACLKYASKSVYGGVFIETKESGDSLNDFLDLTEGIFAKVFRASEVLAEMPEQEKVKRLKPKKLKHEIFVDCPYDTQEQMKSIDNFKIGDDKFVVVFKKGHRYITYGDEGISDQGEWTKFKYIVESIDQNVKVLYSNIRNKDLIKSEYPNAVIFEDFINQYLDSLGEDYLKRFIYPDLYSREYKFCDSLFSKILVDGDYKYKEWFLSRHSDKVLKSIFRLDETRDLISKRMSENILKEIKEYYTENSFVIYHLDHYISFQFSGINEKGKEELIKICEFARLEN